MSSYLFCLLRWCLLISLPIKQQLKIKNKENRFNTLKKQFIMKKLFYLFLFIGLAVTSCNKPESTPLEQEVTFKASELSTGFKAGDICENDAASYVVIKIKDLSDNSISTVTVDVFYLADEIYTNSLKLTPGDYQVTEFMLYDDGDDNIAGNTDDQLVYATPFDDSQLGLLTQQTLPADFTVGAFLKNEVTLDIFCFDETIYEDFGFSWFQFNFHHIGSDLVFFGDFCTKYYEDYTSTPYASQANGLQHDMPAVFEIEVLKNGSHYMTYSNAGWNGEGAPLMVPNPDNSNVAGEEFEFVLSILVKVGDDFEYVPFYTWSRTDNGTLLGEDNNPFVIGDDGVIDFVLGSCVPNADLVLPPYMNLPETATVKTGNTTGGSLGTYFDVTLSDIGAGFDIHNGNYGVYCADTDNQISLNHTYSGMNVFSSLYLADLPNDYSVQKDRFDNINWLGNNLSQYGVQGTDYTWKDVQNAIWLIAGQTPTGLGTPTAIAQQMKTDAMANEGFAPPVGGFAAVIFAKPDASLQLIFTLVDP